MKIHVACVALMLVFFISNAFAADIEINIAPTEITTSCTSSQSPSPGEPVISVPVASSADIIGIGWNTTQTAFAPNTFSGMTIKFYDGNFLLTLNPASQDFGSGGPTNYTSNGISYFSDVGFSDFIVNGRLLRIGICQSSLNGPAPAGRFSAPSTLTIACLGCVPRIFAHGFD